MLHFLHNSIDLVELYLKRLHWSTLNINSAKKLDLKDRVFEKIKIESLWSSGLKFFYLFSTKCATKYAFWTNSD